MGSTLEFYISIHVCVCVHIMYTQYVLLRGTRTNETNNVRKRCGVLASQPWQL